MTAVEPFGAIAKVTKGKKPTVLHNSPAPGRVPYIDISAVERGTRREWADAGQSKVVPAGSLVMVWDGARSGWVGLTKFEGALGSTLAAIETSLNKRFLVAFLRARFGDINSNHRGSGIPHVNPDYLKSLDVPMLSESEQMIFADLVEATTSKAESSASHLAASSRAAMRLRKAVLVSACSGGLTATWRSRTSNDLSMADVLGEAASARKGRKLRRGVDPNAEPDDALTALDLPSSWAVITISGLLASGALEDVKDGNHGANHPKASEFTSSGLPFITANCIRDGAIDYELAPKVSGAALSRLRVGFAEPGDVILTHKGSVGRVAVNDAPCVLTPQTTYYRTDASILSAPYLALFFESLYFYKQLAAVMSQTTRDFVPISDQYLLSVIVPPPDEQVEIVKRVSDLLKLADRVGRRIDGASKRLERSSQAVLAKALRGELNSNGTVDVAA